LAVTVSDNWIRHLKKGVSPLFDLYPFSNGKDVAYLKKRICAEIVKFSKSGLTPFCKWRIQFLKTFLFATYWCIQRIRGFTTMRYINRLFSYLLYLLTYLLTYSLCTRRTNRRTDRRGKAKLTAPFSTGGGIITNLYSAFRSEDTEAQLSQWGCATVSVVSFNSTIHRAHNSLLRLEIYQCVEINSVLFFRRDPGLPSWSRDRTGLILLLDLFLVLFFINFCRAMLCISAAYAIMRCLSVCLCKCVCLSVTFLSCVKTNKHIIKFVSPSGSHAILVFPCQTA